MDWLKANDRLSAIEERRSERILAQMAKMAAQLGKRRAPVRDYQQLVDSGQAMEAAEVVMFVEALIKRAWEKLADPTVCLADKATALQQALAAGFNFGHIPCLRITVVLSICRDLVRCSPVLGLCAS